MNTDYAVIIARMSVTEFRLFKKAFNVLLRAGVAPVDAITILAEKYTLGREAREFQRRQRQA